MIDHDHVETEAARFKQRLVARGSAINGNEEARTLRRQCAHRFRVRAVAFEQAVGNVHEGAEAAMTQVSAQHSGRCRTIDVVVAEDGDGFTAGDGVRQPNRSVAHVGERMRIRH